MTYRVGFIQNLPVFGDIEANRNRIAELAENLETDLLVLPELFTTGYQFTSREEAKELAEPAWGPTAEFLTALSKKKNLFIIAGLVESENEAVYNSSVITGPEGFIGRYRKIHLFDTEKNIFDAGDQPPPVFELGAARVGVMICFDWRFPETARSIALRGADVIAHPSNLVLPHCPQSMITRCLENRVYAITADRVGTEQRIDGETLTFIGQSQVVDPDGKILVRVSADKEESAVVKIDIEKARNKSINPVNDLFNDRRTDLYRFS
ncbi:MAG: acyltransferase [Candidatus Nitronauta litoralis]|uniref:Acyltransferase n=1 Tax=Candidatus Nitronauta litoralis TaxID=2705533 RepID=A0A7T0BUW4_9BACT|nr:MAG: acyltransferase [Candidatus Nitronauta litoralis]